MYKYEMLIDNKPYKALFLDHMEAADFMDEVEREDGSVIIVLGFSCMSPAQIEADSDFGPVYKEEVLEMYLR